MRRFAGLELLDDAPGRDHALPIRKHYRVKGTATGACANKKRAAKGATA